MTSTCTSSGFVIDAFRKRVNRYTPTSNQWYPVLCPFSTPAKLSHPLDEIATWSPNSNPTHNPKPTNPRGVVNWWVSELGTTLVYNIPLSCVQFGISGKQKMPFVYSRLKYISNYLFIFFNYESAEFIYCTLKALSKLFHKILLYFLP